MIAPVYRITTPEGTVIEGRVHGNGGLLGNGGTLSAAEAGLHRLRIAASGRYQCSCYQPKAGHVAVYPWCTAAGEGPMVPTPIVGSTIELVRWEDS